LGPSEPPDNRGVSASAMNGLSEQEKVAHLLRRFGLGASESELEFYGKDGYAAAIDRLLDYEAIEDVEWQPEAFANKQGNVNIRIMQSQVMARLLTTKRPLQERMVLFWHNHFATSAQKVDNAYVMNNQIELFRRMATGNFRELLHAVSKDPAMIFWLDGQENVAGAPNENFAREVMELFTLGIGHYSEEDILEAARAFTGWTYGTRFRPKEGTAAPRRFDRFVFARDRHDGGKKTVLGKTGNLTGEDVLDHLCSLPQTAKFIAAKMWTWFGQTTPPPGLIDRLAKTFRDNDLEIKPLLRAIMEAAEFMNEATVRKGLKNPIDFTVVTVRQLGVGSRLADAVTDGIANRVDGENGFNIRLIRSLGPSFSTLQACTTMGMELLQPPDVSGWGTGSYWITSATMIERVKWAEKLFVGGVTGRAQFGANAVGTGGGVPVGADAGPLLSGASSDEAVDRLASIFDAQLKPENRKVLVEAAEKASGGQITARNANDVARSVCRLMFGTAEFQFA